MTSSIILSGLYLLTGGLEFAERAAHLSFNGRSCTFWWSFASPGSGALKNRNWFISNQESLRRGGENKRCLRPGKRSSVGLKRI